MNTTNIETCTRTWNPAVGCRRHCPYCYACPIAINIYKSFEPRFFPERLIAPRRELVPQVVFVVNMGDLWGDWVEADWIHKVLEACCAAPWHTYQFYTKGPARYSEFLDELPPKAWLGVTIDEGCDVDKKGVRSISLPNDRRIEVFNKVEYPRKFVSIEPFDPTKMDFYREQIPKMKVQWAHVGLRTHGGGRMAEGEHRSKRPGFLARKVGIQPNEYKVRWMEYLEQRKNDLWNGVVPEWPSLIQMYFAEVELGVTLGKEVTVTVLKCNTLRWARYSIDEDSNLRYDVDTCNCPRDCDRHWSKNELRDCRRGLKPSEIKEM